MNSVFSLCPSRAQFLDNILESSTSAHGEPSRVSMVFNGRKHIHTAYVTWKNMLQRCDHDKLNKKYRTYKRVKVCRDWMCFHKFYHWWKANHIYGWEIDKDLIGGALAEYSPESCIYVPTALNLFTTGRQLMRGHLPIGVSIDKETGLYKAQIMHNGEKVYLGLYQCPHIASMAWLSRKIEISRQYADICNMISPELYS